MARPLQFAMSRHKHCYRLHLNTLRRWEPLIGTGGMVRSRIGTWATIWLTIFIEETIISRVSPRQSLPLLLPYGCSRECRLMDPHSYSVRERTLKWICDFPSMLKYLRDNSRCNLFFHSCLMIIRDSDRDRLHDYVSRLLPQFGCLSREWKNDRNDHSFATMDTEGSYACPTTYPLDVELTVQLK